MSDKTVRQLAEIVKIPLERLLEQLKEAGLSASSPDDFINESEKMQLLAHLRKRHGKADSEAANSPRRVTLERRKITEIKQASVPGSSTKTISVEVRKKKTYIKRGKIDEQDSKKEIEVIATPILAEQNTNDNLNLEQSDKLLSVEPIEPVIEIENTVSVLDKIVEEIVAIETVVVSDPEPKVDQELAPEPEPEIEIVPILDIDLDIELEPVEAVESEAKFEALKIKEEKKIKQEKSIKTKEAEDARKKQQEK